MNEREPKLTRTRTFWWSEKNKSYILHLNRLDSAYLRAGIGKLRAVIFSHLHLEINISNTYYYYYCYYYYHYYYNFVPPKLLVF